MTITGKLRKGNINKYLIYKICGNLHNPGRLQMAAAFMAGMVITAALTYFGVGTGKLLAGENDKSIMPEQQSIPGKYVPENYREIVPDKYVIYELVYAFKEGALISG
jgi:hypothetical protein